jgi:glucose/arabinose dehydrogenase
MLLQQWRIQNKSKLAKRNFMRTLLMLLSGCLLLAACSANTVITSSDADGPVIVAATTAPATALPSGTIPPAPTDPPAADTSPPDLASLTIDLELVADGFEQPLYAISAGDGSGRLFIVEQPGRIFILRDGQRLEQPFLDIVDIVGSSGSEQGLLSVAFSPNYNQDGQFFINYTDNDGDTVVARYQVSADPDVADPASAATVLTIDQPAGNHNGGLVVFGPDDYLYIGMGDGGQAGDPWGNAQNTDVLLGKLLRIDVLSERPYAIPPDNPLIDQPEARPEIWSWGLRNPWRFAFDPANDDLYIADVGQNRFEEIHYTPAADRGGNNYGWDIMEGAACFEPDDCDPDGLILPVVVYSRDMGCSITGGYVYRGTDFPQLDGIYFYGDYCSGRIWALRHSNGEWQNAQVQDTNLNITSFGTDAAGELYVTDRNGGVYRLVSR